jgi:hypothetical protein
VVVLVDGRSAVEDIGRAGVCRSPIVKKYMLTGRNSSYILLR